MNLPRDNDNDFPRDELLLEHFAQVGVHGRELELSVLESALDRITTTSASDGGNSGGSEVVLVSGSAGQGKSSLVGELARRRCFRVGGHEEFESEPRWETTKAGKAKAKAHFAAGKFDQLARREPYSAIVDVVSDLCRSGCAYAKDLRSSMDEESRALLERIVPESCGVFGDGDGDGDGDGESKDGAAAVTNAPRKRLSLDHSGAKDQGDRDNFKNAEALNRLNYALRIFMRSISRSGAEVAKKSKDPIEEAETEGNEAKASQTLPVVILLDDLQWADETSVSIVEGLIADPESRGALFILSYRDDEVDDAKTPRLARLLGTLVAANKKERTAGTVGDFDKAVTEIAVGPLGVKAVAEILCDVLSLSVNDVLPLARIVHSKTLGNVLFATQFLISIQERGLLNYSFRTLRWEWGCDAIVACTDIADDVVDIVAGRIGRLPGQAKKVLGVASCLGSSFHVGVLAAAVGGAASASASAKDEAVANEKDIIATVLDAALREGLLERVSADEYKFAHDRISQAAYSLVPEGRTRDALHYRIGKVLWEASKISVSNGEREGEGEGNEGREYMPFLAADQLNRAGSECMSDDAERLAAAELNLAVAEEAMSTGAFIFAAGYLRSGVELLDAASSIEEVKGSSEAKDQKWSDHYDLTLRLCGAAAEAEHCRANFETCESIAGNVLANSRTLRDSLRAYYTLVECQCSAGRYSDALSTGFDALDKLGEPFPKKKPSLVLVARQFFKTSRLLKNRTNEELLALPRMTDRDKIAAHRLMTTLWLACVVSNAREYLLLLTFRMVRLTLRHGVSDFSAVGFAVYGMITCGAISVNKGYRFGPLALQMLESSGSRGVKEWSPRVTMFAFCGVKHFRTPLHECPAPFVTAYNVAMSTGDVEFGMLSALHYCMFYYFSGMSLVPLEKDMRAYCRQMREYKQETSLYACLAYWQCVLNLMGLSENTFVLTGEAMEEKDLRRKAVEAKNMQGVTVIMLLRMQLAYYFGRLDLAKTLLRESQSLTEPFKGAHWGIVQTYFEGLVSLSLARKAKNVASRRAYLKVCRRSLKKLKSLVKCEACNCLHMYLLLKAEHMSLSGSPDTEVVREAYNAAINVASRVGFMQDKALSNELAGKFLLAHGDESWASHYLSQAHESYLEWGAKAKADQLRRDHSALVNFDRSNRRRSSVVGLKSRRTFSNKAADSHRRPSNISSLPRRSSSQWSTSSDTSLQITAGETEQSSSRRRSSRWSLSSESLEPLGESDSSCCDQLMAQLVSDAQDSK